MTAEIISLTEFKERKDKVAYIEQKISEIDQLEAKEYFALIMMIAKDVARDEVVSSLEELEQSEKNYQKFLAEEKAKKRRQKIDDYLGVRSQRRHEKYLASLTDEEKAAREKTFAPSFCPECGEEMDCMPHLLCH